MAELDMEKIRYRYREKDSALMDEAVLCTLHLDSLSYEAYPELIPLNNTEVYVQWDGSGWFVRTDLHPSLTRKYFYLEDHELTFPSDMDEEEEEEE